MKETLTEAVERIRAYHDGKRGHQLTNKVGYCAEPDGISATYCETGIFLDALDGRIIGEAIEFTARAEPGASEGLREDNERMAKALRAIMELDDDQGLLARGAARHGLFGPVTNPSPMRQAIRGLIEDAASPSSEGETP